MKTNLYLTGKKTTRKAIAELIGKDKLDRMISEAKDGFCNDPLEEQSFFLGKNGRLTIVFN